MRHNRIRDLEASILKEVCKDVKVEPEMMPIGSSSLTSSNLSEKARLDVSAVGIWSNGKNVFGREGGPSQFTFIPRKADK